MSAEPPEPVSTPSDVTGRLNLEGIDGDDVRTHLQDAAFELWQANRGVRIHDHVRSQLEWRLAAIDILSHRTDQRAYESHDIGSFSRDYEVSMVEKLREDVARISKRHGLSNPLEDEEFWHASIQG